ncbi:MAG: hypothetical protein DAHOPDDO_00788 [Ignavibacteriaceae bacterium]|nr:hypothetical protein [Ignavibacteriaceae bacterium]
MVISFNDSSLNSICAKIKAKLEKQNELDEHVFNIELLNDFNSVSINNSEFYRNEPAVHQKSSNKVIVNKSIFFYYNIEQQIAIITHEIAHTYICKTNQKKLKNSYFGVLSEEYLADYFVCKWGFIKELKAERMQSYGNEYCKCLEKCRMLVNILIVSVLGI